MMEKAASENSVYAENPKRRKAEWNVFVCLFVFFLTFSGDDEMRNELKRGCRIIFVQFHGQWSKKEERRRLW